MNKDVTPTGPAAPQGQPGRLFGGLFVVSLILAGLVGWVFWARLNGGRGWLVLPLLAPFIVLSYVKIRAADRWMKAHLERRLAQPDEQPLLKVVPEGWHVLALPDEEQAVVGPFGVAQVSTWDVSGYITYQPGKGLLRNSRPVEAATEALAQAAALAQWLEQATGSEIPVVAVLLSPRGYLEVENPAGGVFVVGPGVLEPILHGLRVVLSAADVEACVEALRQRPGGLNG